MLETMPEVISAAYSDPTRIGKLREIFRRNSYVRLSGLLAPRFLLSVRNEVARIERAKVRKNFVMPGYNTPRVMHTIGGRTIRELSPVLSRLYVSEEVTSLIGSISGLPIRPCLHESEFMVINFLQDFGGTHGWHLDDPPLALVLILQAPPSELGGLLEYIPGWREHCARSGKAAEIAVGPLVDTAREMEMVRTVYHPSGDAYLLKADECLHRVTLLRSSDLRRVVINMGFETTDAPVYGETANLLYT